MSRKVFFPQYAKTGLIETLTNYSVGGKNYHVYMITIDEENKFIHDEKEKGMLEYISLEDALQREKIVGKKIGELKKQIEIQNRQLKELEKEQKEKHFIIDTLHNAKTGDKALASSQPKAEKKPHTCSSNCQSHQKEKAPTCPNQRDNNNRLNNPLHESFVLKTPFGFVAEIENDGEVGLTGHISEAKTFNGKEEAIQTGQKIFRNRIPFVAMPVKPVKKNSQPTWPHNILPFFDMFMPGKGLMNIEQLKELFPGAEIQGFIIDENGNMHEL